jgi:hypothetical protein
MSKLHIISVELELGLKGNDFRLECLLQNTSASSLEA